MLEYLKQSSPVLLQSLETREKTANFHNWPTFLIFYHQKEAFESPQPKTLVDRMANTLVSGDQVDCMTPWKLLAVTFKQNSLSHSRGSGSSQTDFALSRDELSGRQSSESSALFERDFGPPAEEVCIKHSAILHRSRSCSGVPRETGVTVEFKYKVEKRHFKMHH